MHQIDRGSPSLFRRAESSSDLALCSVTLTEHRPTPTSAATSMPAHDDRSSRSSARTSGGSQDEQPAEPIARLRAGDEAAFEAVFRDFAGPLCAFAFGFVKSRELAAEVVHDVFLRMWERHERIEVRDSLKAYLYRATRNRALDVLRRDSLLQRWKDGEAEEPSHELTGRIAPPEELVEQRDLASALARVIDDLPDRRRMVLLCRWRDGLRNDQVAELMGISIKTVENQMTQALRTVRARLAPYIE